MAHIKTEKATGRTRNRPLKDYAGCRFGKLTAKRTTVRLVIDGQSRSLSQWAKHFGIEISKASYRSRAGMPVEMVFSKDDHRK